MTISYNPERPLSILCKRSGSVLFGCPLREVEGDGASPPRQVVAFPYLPPAIIHSLLFGALAGLVAALAASPLTIAGHTYNNPPIYAVVKDLDASPQSPLADQNLHLYVGFLIALLLLFRTKRSYDRYNDGVVMAKKLRTLIFDLITETHRSFKLAEMKMRAQRRDEAIEMEAASGGGSEKKNLSRKSAPIRLFSIANVFTAGSSSAAVKLQAQLLRRRNAASAATEAELVASSPRSAAATTALHDAALLQMLRSGRPGSPEVSESKRKLFAIKKLRQSHRNAMAGLGGGAVVATSKGLRGKGLSTPQTARRIEKKRRRQRSLYRQDSLLRRLRNTATEDAKKAAAAAMKRHVAATAAAAAFFLSGSTAVATVGERVRHPKRGAGVVIAVKADDEDVMRTHVRFDASGETHRYNVQSWMKMTAAAAAPKPAPVIKGGDVDLHPVTARFVRVATHAHAVKNIPGRRGNHSVRRRSLHRHSSLMDKLRSTKADPNAARKAVVSTFDAIHEGGGWRRRRRSC